MILLIRLAFQNANNKRRAYNHELSLYVYSVFKNAIAPSEIWSAMNNCGPVPRGELRTFFIKTITFETINGVKQISLGSATERNTRFQKRPQTRSRHTPRSAPGLAPLSSRYASRARIRTTKTTKQSSIVFPSPHALTHIGGRAPNQSVQKNKKYAYLQSLKSPRCRQRTAPRRRPRERCLYPHRKLPS